MWILCPGALGPQFNFEGGIKLIKIDPENYSEIDVFTAFRSVFFRKAIKAFLQKNVQKVMFFSAFRNVFFRKTI